MTETTITHIWRWAIMTGLEVSAPILIAALVSGTLISVLLATTQIQEFTLSFVPKILAVAAAAAIFGPWMLRVLVTFSIQLLTDLPRWAP